MPGLLQFAGPSFEGWQDKTQIARDCRYLRQALNGSKSAALIKFRRSDLCLILIGELNRRIVRCLSKGNADDDLYFQCAKLGNSLITAGASPLKHRPWK